MTPLPLLGGNNGTIGNINQRGEIVGVAENNLQDKARPAPTCAYASPKLIAASTPRPIASRN